MTNFLSDLKKLIIKYYLIAKAKWIGFVTEIKILIGVKKMPSGKGTYGSKRGRPPMKDKKKKKTKSK